MSEKKMVRRSAALALGIVCIVLVAGLFVGLFITYGEISSLNSQISDLNDTVNLGKSILLFNSYVLAPDYGYTTLRYPVEDRPIYINRTGYISVYVKLTTDNTYVRVIYTFKGNDNQTLNYDNQMNASTGETLVFPVLPTNYLEIRLGNTDGFGSNATLTITYYY